MSLFTPQNIGFSDYLDKVKFLLVWRLSLVFTTIFAVMCFVFQFDKTAAIFSYVGAFLISALSVFYLYKFNYHRAIFFFYCISGTVIIALSSNLILDALHFADFLWIIVLSLLAFFGLGNFWGFFFMGLNLLISTYFVFFNLDEYVLLVTEPTFTDKVILTIEIFMSSFLIGYIVFQFVMIQSLSENELVKKNEELEEQNLLISKRNRENTVLVKEIHHRVKNNLQIIISLLRLQMSELKNAEAKNHFSEAINRVMVMSSIHQKLYQEKDITQFNLTTYIEELAVELKQFFKEEFPVEINISSDYNNIDLKTVVPVGLILNELLSNSFKYAFEFKDSGNITINIKDKGDDFDLIYMDNGTWKKPASENSGFGIELIRILTEQLNGSVEFSSNGEGSKYEFHLEKLND